MGASLAEEGRRRCSWVREGQAGGWAGPRRRGMGNLGQVLTPSWPARCCTGLLRLALAISLAQNLVVHRDGWHVTWAKRKYIPLF